MPCRCCAPCKAVSAVFTNIIPCSAGSRCFRWRPTESVLLLFVHNQVVPPRRQSRGSAGRTPSRHTAQNVSCRRLGIAFRDRTGCGWAPAHDLHDLCLVSTGVLAPNSSWFICKPARTLPRLLRHGTSVFPARGWRIQRVGAHCSSPTSCTRLGSSRACRLSLLCATRMRVSTAYRTSAVMNMRAPSNMFPARKQLVSLCGARSRQPDASAWVAPKVSRKQRPKYSRGAQSPRRQS